LKQTERTKGTTTGKRNRERKGKNKKKLEEEEESLSSPLETVTQPLGVAVREPRQRHRPPPQHRQRSS